ncbi:hypothetical protein OF66_0632 [Seleniivibrio woodruffii]|uniref:Phosphatidylglycerol lysyltransferase C-terminal domain-containing protein n=2 Tax=Seleniivibrio woodruffii TaxID=1078050 RepID=A0A4R1KBK4_9BACT|nr:hypothetical protein C8D98_0361 [Seleniivibrio woodruffii]TVZ35030.1 hypothetical protein OF66_0632 [Seleniivibrio woodruffii]
MVYFMTDMIGTPISLEQKPLLEPKLKSVNIPVSEYSFQNLYLFRGNHDYHVFDFEGFTFIQGTTYDSKTHIMPACDLRDVPVETLKKLQERCDFFFPVFEEWAEFFRQHGVELTYQDGDTDYIYTSVKMSTYAGRKLHKKRNLLKQFTERYSATAFMITKDNIKDAFYILDEWQNQADLPKEQTDYKACHEALTLYKELGICGGIYYADKQPAGFILGEELTDNTYVMHFAKGITKYKGIYQFLYNDFASILPKRYEFINFEQDLGSTALRVAKTSYVPDVLVKKYRMRFIP